MCPSYRIVQSSQYTYLTDLFRNRTAQTDTDGSTMQMTTDEDISISYTPALIDR